MKQLIARKGDAAALQQQIEALKRQGAEASEEIDRLQRERALAASYEEARDLDDRIARQVWITEHAAAALPQLELQLAAVRAAEQAAAVARHKTALLDLYPKLKKAILAAVEVQHEAMAAREAACREVGEAAVTLQLPSIAYAGFLTKDLVAIWQAENDRVFAELGRKPKPAAIPAPARAALPAPTKSKAKPVIAAPAPRPKRAVRHDPFPTEGQSLIVFIRGGAELPGGTVAGIGDEVALPADQARQLVLRGVADYATAAVPGEVK